MDERLTVLADNAAQIDVACVRCDKPFQAGDEVVECPRCHKFHHVDCWKEKGGCARQGCPQISKKIVGAKPAGDGLAPPLPQKYFYGAAAIVIILVLAMVFWPSPPDPAMGRTKITFMTPAGIYEEEELRGLMEAWNENHEEIYFDLHTIPYSAMEQKLVVMIAAGDAPDVFNLPYQMHEAYIQNGVLLNLAEDEEDPIWGVQHPAQLSMLSLFVHTEYVEESLELLNYLTENIAPADLEALQERTSTPTGGPSIMGF